MAMINTVTATCKTLKYPAWIHEVNRIVQQLTGLTCDDLPDFLYADAYADERTALSTARAAIRNSSEE